MFNDIFGAPKYSGQVLPKIPYGTKAVKVFQDILFICDIVKEGMLPDENFLSNNISVIVITNRTYVTKKCVPHTFYSYSKK